ncbi:MAG: hypothetical protein U0235_20195 [Polyangiaceae bacterium]
MLNRLFSAPDTAEDIAKVYVAGMATLQREIEDTHDAFLLDPGMGPMLYITSDGRILIDGRSWDGEALREATDDEAVIALVVGARKTKIDALLDLFPPPPAESTVCPMCNGARCAEPAPGFGQELLCFLCKGWGWVTPASLADAATRGVWPRPT